MINLTGQRFGRLLVLHLHPERKNGCAAWQCRCDCGTERVVSGALLRDGTTSSCGCLRRELGRKHGARINLRHGEGSNGKETPEYRTWSAMLSRCRNPTHKLFAHYGGRGITVCTRWETYENFLADMGRRPSDAHSLDRIDVNGPYAPENCRWATSIEQNRNTRWNRRIEIDGVSRCLAEWLEHFSISRRSFYYRVKHGMTEEDALRCESQRGRPLQS